MDKEMRTMGPLERLEQKIDALSTVVAEGFTRVDGQLTNIDQRLTNIDQRLTDVDQRLTDVDQRLTKVHVLAEETKSFSHNVYDSLATLTKNVEEGFKEAAKDRDQKFDVVHKAILHWGERVKVLEVAGRRRATKRRR